MEQSNPNHWRQLFERPQRQQPDAASERPAQAAPLGSYDDGHLADPWPADHLRPPSPAAQAQPDGRAAPSPSEVADEAAMALALDSQEYRPWILQRGTRPVMMLHLRRFEPKSGLWQGWQLSYPCLIAVEYTGDRLLSLDFGTRHFAIKGSGLYELARHLQQGNVLAVQEYTPRIWREDEFGATISNIQLVGINAAE